MSMGLLFVAAMILHTEVGCGGGRREIRRMYPLARSKGTGAQQESRFSQSASTRDEEQQNIAVCQQSAVRLTKQICLTLTKSYTSSTTGNASARLDWARSSGPAAGPTLLLLQPDTPTIHHSRARRHTHRRHDWRQCNRRSRGRRQRRRQRAGRQGWGGEVRLAGR